MNENEYMDQPQQISNDDIEAHLADLYQFDTSDKSGDIDILSDTTDPTQTEVNDKNETSDATDTTEATTQLEQPVFATDAQEVSLTMSDIANINNLKDSLTQSYYDQQVEANKQALDNFLRNPDTGEAWSVEELTGDDGGDGYINKATGRPFTSTEAVNFIQNNRFNYQQSLANFQSNSAKIASLMTNASIDAKYVQSKYGSALEQNPGLSDRLDAAYRKVVKMSDDGKFIVDAPISMREFYDTALASLNQQKTTAQGDAHGAQSQKTATTSSPAQAANTEHEADFGTANRRKSMDDALDDVRSPSDTPDIKSPQKGDLATKIENELMKAYKEHKQRTGGF